MAPGSQAVDVDPSDLDPGRAPAGDEGLEIGDVLDLEAIRRVVDAGDRHAHLGKRHAREVRGVDARPLAGPLPPSDSAPEARGCRRRSRARAGAGSPWAGRIGEVGRRNERGGAAAPPREGSVSAELAATRSGSAPGAPSGRPACSRRPWRRPPASRAGRSRGTAGRGCGSVFNRSFWSSGRTLAAQTRAQLRKKRCSAGQPVDGRRLALARQAHAIGAVRDVETRRGRRSPPRGRACR